MQLFALYEIIQFEITRTGSMAGHFRILPKHSVAFRSRTVSDDGACRGSVMNPKNRSASDESRHEKNLAFDDRARLQIRCSVDVDSQMRCKAAWPSIPYLYSSGYRILPALGIRSFDKLGLVKGFQVDLHKMYVVAILFRGRARNAFCFVHGLNLFKLKC